MEALDIKVLGAFSHLFIRGKGHMDLSMLAAFFQYFLQGAHDDGDAGLVIRSQQRSAIRHDQILSNMLAQHRKRRRIHDDLRIQRDRPAIIVLDDARPYICPAQIGALAFTLP